MTPGIQTNVDAISAYAKQLPFYEQEADKFGALIDTADVTDEAWGLIGLFAKQGYTDRLEELRSLLKDMKDGVDSFVTKLNTAADAYRGTDQDVQIAFGRFGAEIDGVKGPGE